MKFLLVFLVLSSLVPQRSFSSDKYDAEVDRLLRQVTQVVNLANSESDYAKIAELMHSDSLRHFRDIVMSDYAKHLDAVGGIRLNTVLGLSQTDLAGLSDRVFFTRICGMLLKDGGFVAEIKYIGYVSDDAGVYHVLYRYNAPVAEVDMIRPRLMTFKYDGDRMGLYSVFFVSSVLSEFRNRVSADPKTSDLEGLSPEASGQNRRPS